DDFIAASAGKSEDALFLTATPPPGQGGLQSMIATGSLNFANVPTPDVDVLKTADQATLDAGATAGFTVKVFNEGRADATAVTLSDPLPAGAGHDINWRIDPTGPDAGAFAITGPV